MSGVAGSHRSWSEGLTSWLGASGPGGDAWSFRVFRGACSESVKKCDDRLYIFHNKVDLVRLESGHHNVKDMSANDEGSEIPGDSILDSYGCSQHLFEVA